nr:chemotaxis protein CheW [Granulicella aggregans]
MGSPSAAIAQFDQRLTPPSIEPALVPAEDPRAGKHLVFRLATEDFAIRVASVQEILGIMEITSVPQTVPSVKGVINLRGRVIPVIDLRLRLGFPAQAYSKQTCIVVIRTRFGDSDRFTGVIVDEVSEVVNIVAGDIQDTPDFGISTPSPYLLGMARTNDKVRILLDIEQVLRSHGPITGQP